MTFSRVQLIGPTPVLVFSTGGGEDPRPLPAEISVPESVVGIHYDSETETLSGTTAEGEAWSAPLTAADIAAVAATAPAPEPAPLVTLEEWLFTQGYTATCLLLLAQYETALAAASLAVPEATATRAWINALSARYGSAETRANDWASPPHTFEAVVDACKTALGV